MKKLLTLAICLLTAFCMTGCASEEVQEIFDAKDAAEALYTSYDYEIVSSNYARSKIMYDEYSSQVFTFSQDEHIKLTRLKNGNQKGHIKIVNNKGTPIESSNEADYYQRGAYAYYDVEKYGRYYQKSLQTNVNDILGEYIKGLEAKDFKSVKITELKNGGKKLFFVLDPSAVPEDDASEYLLNSINYMPPEFDAVHAKLVSFEYTLELDKNFLTKLENRKLKMSLNLKSGATATITEEVTSTFTKYYNIPDDHIVFPRDLNEYPDHATYVANLPNRNKKK